MMMKMRMMAVLTGMTMTVSCKRNETRSWQTEKQNYINTKDDDDDDDHDDDDDDDHDDDDNDDSIDGNNDDGGDDYSYANQI